MNDHIQFWREIRNTVMLRGEDWPHIVSSLPGRIDAAEARALLQSADQLARSNMQGVAFLAGVPTYATPDPETILKYLPADYLTAENMMLQWIFRFFILEGLARVNHDKPIAEWPPMFLAMYAEGLHFMVYMSALLCLTEERIIVTDVPIAYFHESEAVVKRRVKDASENLCRKAQDYGESFRRHGVVGLLPRLWDKAARYTQLMSQDDLLPNFEPLQDSARDLLGYSMIAWSLVLETPRANDIKKTEVEIP
jgi:hypothetical protein